jgi:hypothetical protein
MDNAVIGFFKLDIWQFRDVGATKKGHVVTTWHCCLPADVAESLEEGFHCLQCFVVPGAEVSAAFGDNAVQNAAENRRPPVTGGDWWIGAISL